MALTRIYGEESDRKYCCPNCGAPIEGDKCEYCGTVFVDFGCIDLEQPFVLKFKKGNQIYIYPVRFIDAHVIRDSEPVIYADNRCISPFCLEARHITLDFEITNTVTPYWNFEFATDWHIMLGKEGE